MSQINKFNDFCFKEDINGLNTLKNTGFLIIGDHKRNALLQSIKDGKLKTVEWLFNNSIINMEKEKLIKLALAAGKTMVHDWLCTYFNTEKIKHTDKSRDEKLNKILEQLRSERKIIVNEFTALCKNGDIKIMDKYYHKHIHILTTNVFDKCIETVFTFDCIKWAVTNDLCINIEPLIKKSLMEDNLEIFKWLYFQTKYKIIEIEEYEKIINTMDKNTATYKYMIKLVKTEKKYSKLLNLCDEGSLSHVQLYYINNLRKIIDQIKIHSISEILERSENNIEVFKWFANLYKIKVKDAKLFLCNAISSADIELADFCKSKLTPTQIRKLDIDEELLMTLDDGDYDYDMIEYILNNGFRLRNRISDVIFVLLCDDKIDLLKKINDQYTYFKNVRKFKNSFLEACQISELDTVKWLHSLNPNIFTSKYDSFYETAIYASDEENNSEVLEWLTTLYDRFYLTREEGVRFPFLHDNNNDSDSEYYDDDDDSDGGTPYNEIYDLILENKENACELLSITKTYKNTSNEDCIICKDKPTDLIQLNCGHHGCITCLATWFKTNDETCVYCKKDVEWTKCKRLNKVKSYPHK